MLPLFEVEVEGAVLVRVTFSCINGMVGGVAVDELGVCIVFPLTCTGYPFGGRTGSGVVGMA